MLIELHVIQNFAPSNLNRDDTNAPKDCLFGGQRRARISSQSLKRAIRFCFREQRLLAPEDLSVRTKRLAGELAERLARRGRDPEEAARVATVVVNGIPARTDAEGKTEYLLFLGHREIEGLADVCERHWEELLQSEAPPAGRAGREAKRAAREAVAQVRDEILRVLDGGKAVDLALFARMIADVPEKNVEAACQVAHAISTHRVEREFDFYTAVDDLRPDDTQGADMMGTVEFNAACFYRYANLDVDQLVGNLQGDVELARRGTEAFLRAFVQAVPTGLQHSFAAPNPPSLVFAVVRRDAHWPWSLANAFVHPVYPDMEQDLVAKSIGALDRYWSRLKAVYGAETVVAEKAVVVDEGGPWPALAQVQVPTFARLVAETVAAAFADRG